MIGLILTAVLSAQPCLSPKPLKHRVLHSPPVQTCEVFKPSEVMCLQIVPEPELIDFPRIYPYYIIPNKPEVTDNVPSDYIMENPSGSFGGYGAPVYSLVGPPAVGSIPISEGETPTPECCAHIPLPPLLSIPIKTPELSVSSRFTAFTMLFLVIAIIRGRKAS